MNLFRKKVGLALSGGGPWGLAHIGVLKVLEENKIPIDYIAGVSAGALIGGFYAAKLNSQEIIDYARSTSGLKIASIFLRGKSFVKFIKDFIGEVTFKELKIPFCAVATDLKTGDPIHIKTGKVADAIRASCAIPVIFKPTTIDKYPLLVDGGLSEPVPIVALKKMGAEIIIAVNLYNEFSIDQEEKIGMTDMARRSLDIMLHNLADEDIKTADVVVAPKISGLNWQSSLREKNRMTMITLGEAAMKEQLPLLKQKLISKNIFSWFGEFFKKFKKNYFNLQTIFFM